VNGITEPNVGWKIWRQEFNEPCHSPCRDQAEIDLDEAAVRPTGPPAAPLGLAYYLEMLVAYGHKALPAASFTCAFHASDTIFTTLSGSGT